MAEDLIDELLGGNKGNVNTSPAGHRERVRETVDRNPDFAGFNEYQMLEWLLFATIARKDTKAIAKDLIKTFGSLSAVLHADYYELIRVKDVGEKTAHLLSNLLPIVLRAEYSRYDEALELSSAEKAAWHLHPRFLGKTKEILLLTSLNINDEIIQTDEISSGTVDSAAVDIMKILRIADRNGAKKIILSHNHPGGTMAFSDADVETTARVVACCMLTGFIFYDHILFSGTKYLSMFGTSNLDKVIKMSLNLCSKTAVTLASEKTRINMLFNMMKLGEQGMPSDPNESKLQVLEAYRQLLAFGDEHENELMFEQMVQTVCPPDKP